jgi:hypothetical protein
LGSTMKVLKSFRLAHSKPTKGTEQTPKVVKEREVQERRWVVRSTSLGRLQVSCARTVWMCVKTLVPSSDGTTHNQNPTLLSSHVKNRYEAEPWLQGDPKSEKRFAKELESIHMTFPSITDRATTLSMAAWFSVLCKIDNLQRRWNPRLRG